MRVITVEGIGAELAAAALIRTLRRDGETVGVARLAPAADAGLPPPHTEFVAAHGALWPNGAFWLEWASDTAMPPTPDWASSRASLVLAVPDPSIFDPASVCGQKLERRAAASVPLTLDRFGRPAAARPVPPEGPVLRIGILGDDRHLRTVNPAVLARLGDVADRAGRLVEPVPLPAAEVLAHGVPDTLHGLILPGGCDMTQTVAQIAAARSARDSGLPVFGLCLGMQSMATALMRDALWPDADFEEVLGPGPRRSLVRLHDDTGAPIHCLGDRPFRPMAGTRLAGLLSEAMRVRMNYRYHLNPEAVAHGFGGAVLHQTDPSGVVDALELPGHPFFIGLQGHPELGCDPALAVLWDAFLAAAGDKAKS
ncbi:MAG TPA: gamma-glutamyl-gamma-aminobutyrate hydrolase family protein [Stellaceae bacterium]|nr:gamma-glutamyl-gamma-aminobutyrate hydrolase family protein [Stellaceae bacterium]